MKYLYICKSLLVDDDNKIFMRKISIIGFGLSISLFICSLDFEKRRD